MREPFSIASTCCRPSSNAARAARQASSRSSPSAGPKHGSGSSATPWAGRLLESVAKRFELKPASFQEIDRAERLHRGVQRRHESGGHIPAEDVGWTSPAKSKGSKEPTIISMLGWPGPFSQYHASNAQPHWITEMMVTKKEPFNAERLLLSTGIANHYMESNWENGRYSAVGRRIETPFMNMKYRTTRAPMFEKGRAATESAVHPRLRQDRP